MNKKMTPFDFLNAINSTKVDLLASGLDEDIKQYNGFMINRGLSYFPDTVLIANEMNKYHQLDKRMQFDFLRNIVRRKKRFSKWTKADKSEDVDDIKEFYGYNNRRAEEALQLLSPEQLLEVKNSLYRGGKKKRKL